MLLPAEAEPSDVDHLRFAVGLRGYRMDQVDQVLDELRDQLAAKDRKIAGARGRDCLRHGTAGPTAGPAPEAAGTCRRDTGSSAPAATAPGLDRPRTRSIRCPAAPPRGARWPWWVQVVGVYLAARLVSAWIFMAAALHQGVNPWFPAKPDYWNFINIWDARWYGEVLANGYPRAADGRAGTVQENAWAFYRCFPTLGRCALGA